MPSVHVCGPFAHTYVWQFERDTEVDDAVFSHFANVTLKEAKSTTRFENELVTKSMGFDNHVWVRIPGTVNWSVSCFHDLRDSGSAWAKGVAVVDGGVGRIAAYLWGFMSGGRVREHQKADETKCGLMRGGGVVDDSHSQFQVSKHCDDGAGKH